MMEMEDIPIEEIDVGGTYTRKLLLDVEDRQGVPEEVDAERT